MLKHPKPPQPVTYFFRSDTFSGKWDYTSHTIGFRKCRSIVPEKFSFIRRRKNRHSPPDHHHASPPLFQICVVFRQVRSHLPHHSTQEDLIYKPCKFRSHPTPDTPPRAANFLPRIPTRQRVTLFLVTVFFYSVVRISFRPTPYGDIPMVDDVMDDRRPKTRENGRESAIALVPMSPTFI